MATTVLHPAAGFVPARWIDDVQRDCQTQTIQMECPCCEGSGYHASHTGNHPDSVEVVCTTCDGHGGFEIEVGARV